MKISFQNDKLKIELKLWEKIFSVKTSDIEIALKSIKCVSTEKPKFTWKWLRCPGTFLPGVIAAGTYYAKREDKWEKEFWCLTRGRKLLVLELKDEKYTRIILGVNDNNYWKMMIDGMIRF